MNKKYFSFGLVLAIIFASASLIGCRKGDKGDPGPAGSGNNLTKDGFISGTMLGSKSDDITSFNVPFKYEYIKSPSDNVLTIDSDGYRYYNVTRYDSTGNSYIKFQFYIYKNGSVDEAVGEYVTVKSFIKESSTATFYLGTTYDYGNTFEVAAVNMQNQFSSNNEIVFTNLVLNPTSGKVTFDYSIDLDSKNTSTTFPATITGSISVNPPTFVYRTTTAQ